MDLMTSKIPSLSISPGSKTRQISPIVTENLETECRATLRLVPLWIYPRIGIRRLVLSAQSHNISEDREVLKLPEHPSKKWH